jgi:hypothetical protein
VPIDVVVRTERGERVASLGEMAEHVPRAEHPGVKFGTVPFPLAPLDQAEAYPMLASVDPYGLTCFNRRQLPRLLYELDAIQAIDPDDDRRAFVAGLRVLTAEHMRRQHMYLWFICD